MRLSECVHFAVHSVGASAGVGGAPPRRCAGANSPASPPGLQRVAANGQAALAAADGDAWDVATEHSLLKQKPDRLAQQQKFQLGSVSGLKRAASTVATRVSWAWQPVVVSNGIPG